MAKPKFNPRRDGTPIEKVPTGIRGLDEITAGGLPRGRSTLVSGGPGSGKTLLSMEFLCRGALQYGEPGVYMAFEETAEDLMNNFASVGYDLKQLVSRKLVSIDHVYVERSEIEETGEYDLEGLFIRLEHAIDSVKAKRVVLDTIEVLFSGLANTSILRAELRRLFGWLKQKGVTSIVTGERGDTTLTRHGLEEYVADCVIVLDHRVNEQISTRRLRIVKYRGSSHGNNEYPFLIDNQGMAVLPVTSLGLDFAAPVERIETGIPRLDAMLGGKGFYRGSSILVSGTAGTGKTSVAGTFAEATCRRGEKCLYFAFEESSSQLVRNLRSISVKLDEWIKKGLLEIRASRPTFFGLETHLVNMHHIIDEFNPSVVIIDPITNLTSIGSESEVKSMLTRLIDHLKMRRITSMFTNLTAAGGALEETEIGVSSLMDTWLLLRDIEIGGERNRSIYILKSRGMAHSNQLREFLITNKGIELLDVYLGPEGVLTGSARAAQEARDSAATASRGEEIERKEREIERKQKLMEAQIAAIRTQFETEREELEKAIQQNHARAKTIGKDRKRMAYLKKADG
jgi:circadian clock protein KaiC